jgi:protoheme IX farnesyltransferase
MLRNIIDVFKLRIGMLIALTALGGLLVMPGPSLPVWKTLVLVITVFLASAAAGAFNQYSELDIDRRMARTRKRPFVTGALPHNRYWLLGIGALLLAAVLAATLALNWVSALYIFLGAFTYAVVYTVWLKRRTWLNIVFGGLAGSFAVLAGAAAVDPALGPLPLILAIVLFLWTPSHFWSLAIALHQDYKAAGVPMLPVVKGDQAAARVILGNTLLLVLASVAPVFYGLGGLYLAGAMAGGIYFLYRNVQLVRDPTPKTAMTNFFASLIQLSLLLLALMLEVGVRG